MGAENPYNQRQEGRFMKKRLKVLIQRLTLFLNLRDEFLCDGCKLNYRNLCVRRERPNARICPDFEEK